MKFVRILLLFLFVFNHNVCNSYSQTNDYYSVLHSGVRSNTSFYPRFLALYGICIGAPYAAYSANFISDIQIKISEYNLLLFGLQLTYQQGAEYETYTNEQGKKTDKRVSDYTKYMGLSGRVGLTQLLFASRYFSLIPYFSIGFLSPIHKNYINWLHSNKEVKLKNILTIGIGVEFNILAALTLGLEYKYFYNFYNIKKDSYNQVHCVLVKMGLNFDMNWIEGLFF